MSAFIRLLFDFEILCCYVFCSCGLLGSFLFARHVISTYNVFSGRTMFNINRKDGLFLALSSINAGSGCFVDATSTLRLDIFIRNFSYKEKYI